MRMKKRDYLHHKSSSRAFYLMKILVISFIIAIMFYLLLFSFGSTKNDITNQFTLEDNKTNSSIEVEKTEEIENTKIESDYSNVLKDAIECVGSNSNTDIFMSKSFEERKYHAKWINDEIQKIIPKKMSHHCWSGFCGPWLEDIWNKMENEDFHIFGPFIPLFVPWSEMWITNSTLYINWRNKIIELLQKDYFYITLSSNSAGIEGRDEQRRILPDNLLIISSGGRGHIPILMFMKELSPNDYPINENYEYDLMFVGTYRYKIRQYIIANYSKMLGKKFKYLDKYTNFRIQYDQAKFVCAPRGYGRSSYRLSEILQTGRVPVYVYNDIIWLPYYNSINWSDFSIITNVSRLNETIDQIKNTPVSEITQMRRKIKSMYYTHFSIDGTFKHIKSFLLYGFSKSDLRCAKHSYVAGITD